MFCLLFRTHFTYGMRKSIDYCLIKWISCRMWTVSLEDRIWKPNQTYMQCEQSQSTSVQCSFWLFYSVLNYLIRYLNLKVKIMESLDWKKLNSITIPTKLYTANTNRLHCLKMILQGRCIPDISITSINDKPCKAFCSSFGLHQSAHMHKGFILYPATT